MDDEALVFFLCGDKIRYHAAIPNVFAWASVKAGAVIKGGYGGQGFG